jgi:putative DNA primase/helicase
MPPSRSLDAADGRWFDILTTLGGIHADYLQDRHGPCPLCGGEDRFRWDDLDGKGGGYCNQCGGPHQSGGGISGITLLMRARDLTFKDAARAVEQHLGLPSPARPSSSTPPPAPPRKPRRPARIPDKPPADATPPTLDGAVAQWPYRDDNGDQLFWIQRVNLATGGKLFIHRTWIDGRWHRPSKRDPFTSEWPSPRPLYNLHLLKQHPDLPVLLTEGEQTCDAAARLFSPSVLCLAWPNGSKAIDRVDFTPLAGRKVTLWPDADDAGRLCMAKLAPILLAAGVTRVRIVQPPTDVPKGWDLADATDWDTERARAHVAAHRSDPITLPEPKPEPEPETDNTDRVIGDLPKYTPFTCLGFDGDAYYYQPANTGQVMRLTGAGHSSTNLLRLATIAYWETLYPAKTGVSWNSAVSDLFAQQAAVGIYSPDRIRGRGAWWDQGRSVLHLGDRLIVDGATHSVMAPPPSRFSYQRLAAVDIPDTLAPLTDQQGAELLDIASRFHWEVPASGLLLAGWTALAPICGALSWRPHAWLTASPGSGKSAILDRFLGTLLDSMALWPEGTTTEAFIRQELRADAIPVVFDEAESNEKADQQRIQNILALARVASSSGRGVIGKGGADGAAQRFTIRSMFLLCSVSTALKQGADQSRFAQLTLRNPNHLPKSERIAHWNNLDRDLTDIITPEIGHRLILRSVRLIPIIRDSVAAFRRAAADRFDSQRQGDQYGTILAGAWSLMNSTVATIDDAYALIDQNDWESYREATELPDEHQCLQAILQHQIRVEGDRGSAFTRTVSELIDLASPASLTTSMEVSQNQARAHLGRIGLKVDHVENALCLMVHNHAIALRRILTDTPWAHCWPTVLRRLPGASKAPVTRFIGQATVARATAVPLASIG